MITNLILNNVYRRTLTLIFFLLGIIPVLLQDTGFNLDPSRNIINFLKPIFEPLGVFGWNDYGIIPFHLIALILTILSITHREQTELNYFDILINTLVILVSGFLIFGFIMILIVILMFSIH